MYTEPTLSKETLDKLPRPTGYRILISIAEVEEKTRGGIILPDSLKAKEDTASIIGRVLKMGPDCYLDSARFPSGPYCKEGDLVMIRAYAGTRFRIEGKEYRILNDDVIESLVDSPNGIERA
jgi:chaperonin GroES